MVTEVLSSEASLTCFPRVHPQYSPFFLQFCQTWLRVSPTRLTGWIAQLYAPMTLPSSQGQEPNFFLTGFLKLVKFSFSQNPICTSCQSWFSKHNSQLTVTDTSIPSTGQSTTTAGRILSDGFYPKQWNFTELAQANPNKREVCLLLAFLVPVYRLLYKGILV